MCLRVTPSHSKPTMLRPHSGRVAKKEKVRARECQGMPGILPCPDYCVNVMKECLAYHAELEASWFKYIGIISTHYRKRSLLSCFFFVYNGKTRDMIF